MIRTAVLGIILVLAAAVAPAIAQPSRVATVEASPFVPGTSRAYDASGRFVGSIVESPFVRGQSRVYDAAGAPTGIEPRENPFLSRRIDVYDSAPGDE